MANGTIAFDTLTTSDSVNTGTEKSIDTSYIFNGSSKSWVNLDGTDASATARDSFNIGSTTDTGTGNYKVTFTNNMSNDDFAHNVSSRGSTSAYSLINDGAYATSSMGIYAINPSNGNLVDVAYAIMTLHGDLA
tara:strand:+ start:185 stop:586 length:402 start_codon:yes stop_codon:yes gene_type:complete